MRPLAALMTGVLAFGLAMAAPSGAVAQSHPAPAQAPVPSVPPVPPAPWVRQPATEVQLRNLAAVVRVVPEPRDDVALSIANPGPLPAPQFRLSRRTLVIDGGLGRRAQCGDRGGFSVNARGQWVREASLPVIELRVPRDAVISSDGAVRMHIGPSQNARLALAGCGLTEVERVVADANVALASGAMTLHLFDAGTASVQVAGAGDVMLGAVRNGLTLSLAGSGDVSVARADGEINIAVQGSGDVLIRDGRASNLSVAIAGSGDVVHQGEANHLDAAIIGSGDVHVRRVTGGVSQHVFGSGEVIIGH
ncbi:MAG TPA: DUF2807 domain-containing protein [Caulobacterales bacterium]|nr:DUF2807 domain-containing protein [Caulobacterales bacterium]